MTPNRLLLPTIVCAIGVSPATLPQTINPSAREILNGARPLLTAEIASVLEAARHAIDGRTCRLSYQPGGPGPEVLMGSNGRPRFVRAVSGFNSIAGSMWTSTSSSGSVSTVQPPQETHVDVVSFTEYTNAPARSCGGATLGGELVIEYERHSLDNQWTVKARTRTSQELATPIFDILAGATPVESGGRRQIGERPARSLVAPWPLPSDAQPASPLPPGVTQSLWIDTDSLLPLRWSISMPAMSGRGMPAIPDYGLSFTYDPSLDVRPPDGVARPDCVR
ncbi:MAG: hypothetical protein DMF95_28195 [Acidobacteria bacterium]|nr:MAG: hypothetical protein DMF95_28195 [Acidobacteriota bacterium]